MKVRLGYVSNSSSSSFVIGLAQIGEEKFEAVKQFLRDQDIYFGSNKNYLFVDTSDQGIDTDDLCATAGISAGDYFMYYS